MNNSYLYLSILMLFSCGGNQSKVSDTCKSGIAKILVEESFKPLFETSSETFESLAPKADSQLKYMAEGNIIDEFYKGQIKTNEEWLEILAAHPILIERPIIETDTKAMICRPPELVYELLRQ